MLTLEGLLLLLLQSKALDAGTSTALFVDLIPQTSQGLFFRHCRNNGSSFEMSLQRTDLSDNTWHSLKKVILKFKDIEIRSGNCKFNNEQWESIVVG